MLLLSYETKEVIIPMLTIVSISAIMEFFDSERVTVTLYILFLTLSFFQPAFLLGIPLILYDLFLTNRRLITVAALIPWITEFQNFEPHINMFLLVMVVISIILKYKAVQYRKLHEEYIR